MAITVSPDYTIYDLGISLRFKLKTLCESPSFPKIVGGVAFAGLSMIIGSLAMSALSVGLGAPLLIGSIAIGCILLGGAVIAGLLYGLNKLLPQPTPQDQPGPRI
ncbi:hypothetical protein [Legionella sp. W05-934-2]|jgi:hypothetical protein|uniref:hypothetical protein n=1 Tax=Legionella sp. W05-934-2 TaxID=1198649 RepID=UPI003461B46F